jgi:hypothetical protein
MDDGLPFPVDLQRRAIARVARDRTVNGGIGHEERAVAALRDRRGIAGHCHVHRRPVVKRIDSFMHFAHRAAMQCAIGATSGDASGQAVKPLS